MQMKCILNPFKQKGNDLSIYLHLGRLIPRQVNVGGIQIFLVQFQALKLRKEILNAANIYLFGFKLTKCKYIDRSIVISMKTSFVKNTE